MKKCRITVMRMACYRDLMEKYENPLEHPCDLHEGQVFIANGWQKPEGLCDSAWQTMSPFVMTLAYGGGRYLQRLDEKQKISDDFLQRRLSAGQLLY